jgi:dihydrofolate synthase/folylpolyglutamate synthase
MAPEHRGGFRAAGVTSEVVDNIGAAIERALAEAESHGVICVTGSLFVAAEAREHLGQGKKERV